jgi:hypothetical protein
VIRPAGGLVDGEGALKRLPGGGEIALVPQHRAEVSPVSACGPN